MKWTDNQLLRPTILIDHISYIYIYIRNVYNLKTTVNSNANVNALLNPFDDVRAAGVRLGSVYLMCYISDGVHESRLGPNHETVRRRND